MEEICAEPLPHHPPHGNCWENVLEESWEVLEEVVRMSLEGGEEDRDILDADH